MRGHTHDLARDVTPPLADARAGDDVLAVRPLLLGGVHAPHDLAEDLRQHARPPIIIPIRRLLDGAGDPALDGGALRRQHLFERFGELAGAEDLPQRHGQLAATTMGPRVRAHKEEEERKSRERKRKKDRRERKKGVFGLQRRVRKKEEGDGGDGNVTRR